MGAGQGGGCFGFLLPAPPVPGWLWLVPGQPPPSCLLLGSPWRGARGSPRGLRSLRQAEALEQWLLGRPAGAGPPFKLG